MAFDQLRNTLIRYLEDSLYFRWLEQYIKTDIGIDILNSF